MSEVSNPHVDSTIVQYAIMAHASRAQDFVVIVQRERLSVSLHNLVTKLSIYANSTL